ncbi:MAG: tetratricopeptide repeat protein [Bacteroidota bacterium]
MKKQATKARNIIVVLSALCVLLSVLLFIANRVPNSTKPKTESKSDADFTPILSNAVKGLSKETVGRWNYISANTTPDKSAEIKLVWYDSLIIFWDNQNRPDLAAFFSKEKAQLSGKSKDWDYAGKRFFFAVKFIKDAQIQAQLYSLSRSCFEKTLSLDPGNIDAKIDLASCMVESSTNPMEGISILREIEKQDSNNVKLQLTFGFFSIKSQQWDRAIARFKKALMLDTNYIEVHLHLADAYEQSGRIKECKDELNRFLKKTNDPVAKETIQGYLNKLKTTN